jgi:hypothetical protein
MPPTGLLLPDPSRLAPPAQYVAIWRAGTFCEVYGPADQHTAALHLLDVWNDRAIEGDELTDSALRCAAPETLLDALNAINGSDYTDHYLAVERLTPILAPPLAVGQLVYYYTQTRSRQQFVQATVEKVTPRRVRLALMTRAGEPPTSKTVAPTSVYPTLILVETDLGWDGQPFLHPPERHRVIAGRRIACPPVGRRSTPRQVYAILTRAPEQVAVLLDYCPTLRQRDLRGLHTEAALPAPDGP